MSAGRGSLAAAYCPLPPLAEFTTEEYDETKAETLDQLREFQAFLERSLRGDMTLVDEFGHAQLVRRGTGRGMGSRKREASDWSPHTRLER